MMVGSKNKVRNIFLIEYREIIVPDYKVSIEITDILEEGKCPAGHAIGKTFARGVRIIASGVCVCLTY